jgi:hypothetical protein
MIANIFFGEILKPKNAQEWLDEWYPINANCKRTGHGEWDEKSSKRMWDFSNYGKRRSEITHLDISRDSDSVDGRKLTGSLDLSTFVNLVELICSHNQLTSLNLSKNTQLRELNCPYNQLTSLDVSINSQLTTLYCSENQLTSLDVSSNSQLTVLECRKNQLTFLNLSKNTQLTKLTCSKNQLTFLDLSNNLELSFLECSDNQLIELIIESNSQLTWLGCSDNPLSNDYLLTIPTEKLTWFTPNNSAKELLKTFLRKEELNTQLTMLMLITGSLDTYPLLLKRYQQSNKEKLQKQKIHSITSSSILNNIEPTLERLLGRGGQAAVYYGKWKGQEVAVKKSLYALTPEEIKVIKKEVDILKNLRNKYIIQYYDSFQNSSDFLVILEYAELGSLTDFIRDNENKFQNWGLNFSLIKNMTSGLTYLHHQKVIHRDLKSMNVLITQGNIAKISDFGLATVVNSLGSVRSRSKGLMGTVRWFAPELMKGQSHSYQSDIYTLGMVFWEIAAQQTIPFSDKDDTQVLAGFFMGMRETIPRNAPKVLKEIITGCWKEEPQERISLEKIASQIENSNEFLMYQLEN